MHWIYNSAVGASGIMPHSALGSTVKTGFPGLDPSQVQQMQLQGSLQTQPQLGSPTGEFSTG